MPLLSKPKPSRKAAHRPIAFGETRVSPLKKQSQRNNYIVSLSLQRGRKRELRHQLELLRGTRQCVPNAPSPPHSLPFTSDVFSEADPSCSIFNVSPDKHCVSSSSDSGDAYVRAHSPTNTSFLHELPGSDFDGSSFSSSPQTPRASRHTIRKQAARPKKERKTKEEQLKDALENWERLMGPLMGPLLQFKERTLGQADESGDAPVHVCLASCMIEETEIHMYSFHYHLVRRVIHCRCQTLPQSLVAQGFFPTSPAQPRMAFSIHLLEFYRALCEQSSDAVTALAAALESTYRRRGLPLVNSAGTLFKDPLRRALGQTLQWYDILSLKIDRGLDDHLESLKTTLPPLRDTISSLPQLLAESKALSLVPRATTLSNPLPITQPAGLIAPTSSMPTPTSPPIHAQHTNPPSADAPTTASSTAPVLTTTPDGTTPTSSITPAPTTRPGNTEPPLSSGRCSGYLQRLCPACFGGGSFGLSFEMGGDIHVAVDGNFHHRHLKSGGDGLPFYESYRFIPQAQVDQVGAHIEAARKKPPKAQRGPVPDDVVDADGKAYKAARGESQKARSRDFDENGMMALVCRHDIPLLAVSINTLGEQQKYVIAMLLELFAMLPPEATAAVLYDIACVTDRSVRIYDILPEHIVRRLIFATAVMHAYGHQWCCQIYYNPRLRQGLGLTDGEGTERLWSALRKLIGLERRSSRHREDLGVFISRKLIANVQKKEAAAITTLRACGIPLEDLQTKWKEQSESQTSRENLAPARLKKELEKMLCLQTEIEDLEITIAETRAAIQKLVFPPAGSLMYLSDLEKLHEALKAKAEVLYTTLNIPQKHLSLSNVPVKYIHTLLLARDLKYDIRKRAIATFQEYGQLDQAVRGAHQLLGTRNHQIVLKNMSKQKLTFKNTIQKFNQFCTYLETYYQPEYNLPIPRTLPLTIASFRDPELNDLWEDVWVTNSQPLPDWLTDDRTRKAIHAANILLPCAKERPWLSRESKNLCTWFHDELYALTAMSQDPIYIQYHALVMQQIKLLLLQADLWATPFVPKATFDEQVRLVHERLQPVVQPQHAAQQLIQSHLQPKLSANAGSDGVELTGDNESDREVEVEAGATARSADDDDAEDGDDNEIQTPWIQKSTDDILNDLAANDPDEDDDAMALTWALPENLTIDSLLPASIMGSLYLNIRGGWQASCVMFSLGKRWLFCEPEFSRIDDPRARLDDDCINSLAHLLLEQHRGTDGNICAYLSTYTVPELLKSNLSTKSIWQTICPSRYWTKAKWIIPIHSRSLEHWAVAVVNSEMKCIHLFDSLGSKSFLDEWLPRIQLVTARLVQLAQDRGHSMRSTSFLCLSDWSARPLDTSRRQSNNYDCGLWVLWVAAAVIRGFDYAYLEDKDMVKFRKYLAKSVRTLPLYTQ